jgi:hypothetical protein
VALSSHHGAGAPLDARRLQLAPFEALMMQAS